MTNSESRSAERGFVSCSARLIAETAAYHHAEEARADRSPGRPDVLQRDEWLVGRGYLSAESISLVIAGPDDHPTTEIKEEVPELQAA